MEEMMKELYELLSIVGPSGREADVAAYLQPRLTTWMDWVFVDAYGNLLGEKRIGSGQGSTVLLSAHMDTVSYIEPGRKILIEGHRLWASKGIVGGDDRAGIAILLHVLRQLESTSFQGTIKVAFTREEEIGCLGSKHLSRSWLKDVTLAIVVDRKGNRDIVTSCGGWYAFCCPEVGSFFEEIGRRIGMPDWKATAGGVSDVMIFASYDIESVNLSAGYYHPHTADEYVDVKASFETAALILSAMSSIHELFPVKALVEHE